MNTLDDLRHTLEQHSHDTSGLDPVTRRTRVGERITTTKRRRAAARGGVALAAVVAVAGAVLLPMSGDDVEVKPAARTLLGQEAPASLTAPDHTYRFVRGVEDAEASTLEVDLEFSDQMRILSWTTAGDDQGVRVTGPYDDQWESVRGDFEDWVAIPPGFTGAVTVATNTPGTAGLGAAVYEADPTSLPDVVDGFHGQYFRAEGPTTRRIAVAVGEPGETELTFPYRDAGRQISIELSCDGLPAGLAVHAEVGGMGTSTKTDVCQGDRGDEENVTLLTKDLGLVPGSTSTADVGDDEWSDGEARVWISESITDETPVDPADHPEAQLAAAVYVPKEEPVVLAGSTVPTTTWHNGHLWRLVRSETDVVGPQEVSGLTRGTPGLVIVVTEAGRRRADVAITTFVDGELIDRVNVTMMDGGSSYGPVTIPLGAREVETRIRPMQRGVELDASQHLAGYELLR